MLLRPIDRSLRDQEAGGPRPTTPQRPDQGRGTAAVSGAENHPPRAAPSGTRPPANMSHNSTFTDLKVTPNGLRMADDINYDENAMHKTILVGDSGVGKTSLLVQFDQGKFSSGSFSATVGIGFTVMLIGDSGVGKTCLLVRFKDNAFLCGNFISTVGIDFRNKVVNVDGTKVKLQIWDTAGQERFRSVTHAYYRDAHALLLLYDVTNKASFDNIRAWLAEINEYAQDDVVIMLLGNKADMSAERVIRTEDGQRLAKEYDVAFMETSAKTGLNVELAFMAVARDLKSKKTRQPDEPRFNVADYVDQEKQKAGCCS